MPNVLLVEAERSLMQRMGWILLEAGFVTARVPFADDVEDKLATFTPDVIVMNNDHPADAKERIVRTFRRHLPHVRIIDVHTPAHAPPREHECGADDYLHLPFDADDLVNAVEQLSA